MAGLATVVVVAGAALALATTGATDGRAETTAVARSGAAATPAVHTAGFPSGGDNPGIFTDRCAFTHEAADDPIMLPGRAGASMQHDFFGNTATSATSTATSLVGGRTTCTTTADASAYWAPVLYQNGRALTPKSALLYWRQDPGTHAVTTIPAGLQMIAGDESATAPQSTDVTSWNCVARGGGTRTAGRKGTAVPHDCASDAQLKLTIHFPTCWDGRTLSGAQQTDVVYPGGTGCPADHPDVLPQIVFHVVYPTASAAGLSLSMSPTMRGTTDTAHADFVNGWTQDVFAADVQACVATSTRCGGVSGAAATPKGPNRRQLRKQRTHHR